MRKLIRSRRSCCSYFEYASGMGKRHEVLLIGGRRHPADLEKFYFLADGKAWEKKKETGEIPEFIHKD